MRSNNFKKWTRMEWKELLFTQLRIDKYEREGLGVKGG